MGEAGDLDSIAAELYAGSPDEFIAARNVRAKDVGDPALSAAVRALRKPSVAAWVVNLFARERSARLGQVLQLASELREAQNDLDAATLSQLGRQRRALTGQLAAEAVSLATARGGRVTHATLEAVRQTISAAFFDPEAAAAVASGRLVRDIEPTGSFDAGAVVAGGRPDAPVAPKPAADEVAARRARRDAERALREAEQAHAGAERAARRADEEAHEIDERIDQLTQRISELEDELQHARHDATRAKTDARAATDRRRQAAAEREAAADAVARAREALDQL
ncbi:transposase [Microbacterium sp. nov. GSS16]|uniref:transposase n=1 Tax=Microbacterium sp. nov. GSS16 TaxID=3019890 RepID=UPI002306D7DD|nr:transposase [Microbacterium sp. nov. GSS16]WCD93839.1 transposase [Microbacterium sp. nov. GSS16]